MGRFVPRGDSRWAEPTLMIAHEKEKRGRRSGQCPGNSLKGLGRILSDDLSTALLAKKSRDESRLSRLDSLAGQRAPRAQSRVSSGHNKTYNRVRQVCHAVRYTGDSDRSRRAGRHSVGDLQSPASTRRTPGRAAPNGTFTFAWCLAKIRARFAPVGCACARESFERAAAAWL